MIDLARLSRLCCIALAGAVLAGPAAAQNVSVPSPNVSVPAPNVAVPAPNVSMSATPRYHAPPKRPPYRGRIVYAPAAPPYGTQAWRVWCARKYPSFDPASGLYTDRSGFRRPCG